MLNLEIAKIFYDTADILEILGVAWKPIAYRKAARTIESLKDSVKDIYEHGGIAGLQELPGIGEGIAKKVIQFIETGKISEYEKLKTKLPAGFSDLLEITGLGPKKVKILYQKLKIKSVSALEKAIYQHRVAKLSGFGAKTEENILAGIGHYKLRRQRMLLGEALPIADDLVKQLKKLAEVKIAEPAGSLRRRKETVGDIDILIVPINEKPKTINRIMKHFTSLPDVSRILAKGSTKSSVILRNGIQSDVRVIPEKSFGAALQYFTGNIDHNIKLRGIAVKKGYKLSEYGLFARKTNKYVTGRTEEEIYKKLGLRYIEPELRENTGEVEAAQAGLLPHLVQLKDIKGDLHLHTNWSDGSNTIEQIIGAARKLKYEYIALTDHSKSDTIAHGMDEERLEKYISVVRAAAKKYKDIKVLIGSEVYIHADGSLDFSDDILKKLDIVIASIHRNFKLPKEQMTERILCALENKYVNIFGHPTTRQINIREPIEFDKKEVFKFCAERGVILEANASPMRLDLKDIDTKEAISSGCKIAINTDAHNTNQLNNMQFGVATAKRGWAEAKDVVNTRPLASLQKIFKRIKF